MTAPPEHAAVKCVLEGHPEIILALLFGSTASGNAGPESDLDIAVGARRRALNAGEKAALVGELAEATGRPVDLVDLATAGEPLLGQILQKGRRIVGSDTDQAELVIRHLREQTDFLPYRQRILAERRQRWIGS